MTVLSTAPTLPSELSRGVYRRDGERRTLAPTGTDIALPTTAELWRARDELAARWPPTPAYQHARLSQLFDRDVWIKLEAASPIRSFKHRGALWAVRQAQASGATRVVTASTGNHGQGMALAARQLGMAVTVFTPEKVDEVKRRQMLELGATLEGVGATLTDAERAAKAFAAEVDARYVEDGEDPALMAGAASIGAEILEQVDGVETIVVPVGGGNLIAGIGLALQANERVLDVELIGAQSTAASGVTASWLEGQMRYRSCTTLAGGLATEHPGLLSLSVIDATVAAMMLVDESDLWDGIGWVFDEAGLTLEMAGVAPFVAMRHFSNDIAGERVVLIASGACIERAMLVAALSGVDLATWLEHRKDNT